MSLEPGVKLAHYEISQAIGKGGMGEVYQATDTKLGREVAIKVLPDEFARDEERLRRFQREAKLLALLNHPNIAAIYGLEQSGDTHYLVLELVPGETLAERIARRPMPLDEALPVARQIAEALEEAHERGVVHRDLKPANVKLTDDGKVKVLDFGLAKAFFDEAAEVDSSMSPTITRDATRMGVILGTAAYMSPEQAKGKQVDKRTDVWAFGVVLYEMLTGKRAFAAEDVSETLALVLTRELDDSTLPATTPASIRRLLRRCVTRERKNRLGDMATARLEIDEASGGVEAPGSQSRKASAFWQRPAGLAIFGLAALAIGGAVARSLWRPAPAPVPLTKLGIALPEGERFSNTGRHVVAIAPDGTYVVYPAEQALWLRRLDQLEATRIPGSDGGREPFISPDSQWIGFWAPDVGGSGDGQLKKVSVSGGAPIPLCDAENLFGASWEHDDTILFGQRTGIWRVPASRGSSEPVIELGDSGLAHGPQLLPDGEWVLFTLLTSSIGSWENAEIVVQSLRTGVREVLLETGRDARYLPTGHLVYAQNGVLFGVAFDPGRRAVLGGPVSLVEGVGTGRNSSGAVHFDVSDSGSLVYHPGVVGDSVVLRHLVRVDGSGNLEEVSMEPGAYLGLSLSPDGSKVALGADSPDNQDIWVVELARGSVTRITRDAANNTFPLWGPAGQTLVFESHRDGEPALYRKASDGTGAAELFFKVDGANHIAPEDWTSESDGKQLVVTVEMQDGDWNIGLVSSSDAWVPVIHTEEQEFFASLSPDGRWLAYSAEETGRNEVYVQRFPELGGRIAISVGGGFAPRWSHDGTELFYLRAPRGPPEAMMRVAIESDGSTLTPGPPEKLFDWSFYDRVGYYRRYELLPDGRFLLLADVAVADDASSELTYDLVVVQNWIRELTERVPVR